MANFAGLGGMIADLKQLKKKCNVDGEDDDDISEAELKSMDKFQRKKYEVNQVLKNLREGTAKLAEMRKGLAPDDRPPAVIRLLNENAKLLKTAGDQWKDLKAIVIEDDKKRRKQLGDQEIADRLRSVDLLGEEIKSLSAQNTRVKTVKDAGTADMENRQRTRTEKRRNERAERKKKERGGGGKGKVDPNAIELDDDDFRSTQVTAQEQVFYDQVEANIAEQEEILDEISAGLDELKNIAQDIDHTLDLQKNMISEVGDKMDRVNEQFVTANSRLKGMLDQQGGVATWCPRLICLLFLLALVGYLVRTFVP